MLLDSAGSDIPFKYSGGGGGGGALGSFITLIWIEGLFSPEVAEAVLPEDGFPLLPPRHGEPPLREEDFIFYQKREALPLLTLSAFFSGPFGRPRVLRRVRLISRRGRAPAGFFSRPWLWRRKMLRVSPVVEDKDLHVCFFRFFHTFILPKVTTG